MGEKQSVLDFIRNDIKKCNNVKDILDNITDVSYEVIEGSNNIVYRSSRGFYYERLWDLCVKFGVTNLTLPAINEKLQTSHIIHENPNNIEITFKSNCWDGNKLDMYLKEKIRSGNSGGYSDITFFNQKYNDKKEQIGEEELYFISVKYFENEKEISKYDIGKLCSLIQEYEKQGRIIKLYIFVNNKQNAINKFKTQHTSSNILIKYINPGGDYENIYDINDLQEAFFKLKQVLKQYNYLQSDKDISVFQTTYLNVLKYAFIPRFHQQLFITKINELIKDDKKNMLVGAIPRSGKSYIMAGTILEYIKRQDKLNPTKKVKILLMSPAPNETFNEYNTIFNKYIDFHKLKINVVTYSKGFKLRNVCKNEEEHCVIIISKQKLGWSPGNNAEKILQDDNDKKTNYDIEDKDEHYERVKKKDEHHDVIEKRIKKLFGEIPNIDLMFLDEAHFGMSTEKAQKIVNVLDGAMSNTIKVYVTATYNKPLQAYSVNDNCKLTWDMNDIHIMQNLNKKTLENNAIKTQFGNDIYNQTLEYFGYKDGDNDEGETLIDKFKKDYAIFPKPYLITSVWDKEFLNVEKLKIGDTEFGWDMNKLFATKDKSDTFENEEQLKEMMRYYFGYPNKNENYDKQSFYRIRGILPRIRNICLNKCRTLQHQHKTTQLWFLPVGNGNIKKKTNALITLLTKSNEFNDVKRNYHFFIAVEDISKKGKTINNVTYMNDAGNIKSDIEKLEKDIKEGKIEEDNLIILAGQRLQLGISLRNVDIVTLWNSVSSADAIFQMLFRSMTEVDIPHCKSNEYCPQKKFGFMVDMNPQRALTNVSLFSANISKEKDAGDIQKYRQITDLINIDEDVLYDKYGDNEESRNDYVKDLFNKLYASWNINVENIKTIIRKFTFDMTKLESLKTTFESIHIEKDKIAKDEIDGKDDNEIIDPGKKKEKTGETKKKNKNEIQEKEVNLTETATELISEFISLLNIFTLYSDEGMQCILTDSSNSNAQITIIDDINTLKKNVYDDDNRKENFLKILNGRLSGNTEKCYSEIVIDNVLQAIYSSHDKLVVNKIIMSQRKQYYTIREPGKLLEFINSQLKPKEKEKKENGEVFTPLSIVNEMLDKLDEAYVKQYKKSIFTEYNFTWLDPAVGIGNFPIIVYQRLMKGLEIQQPNEEKRRKHILEKMIYASEITPKNVFIYKKIFCADKYTLNILQGDTLNMNIMEEFNLDPNFKFDVIIGNPPYNKGGIRSHTGKQLLKGTKSETIWTKFIEKSFEWLRDDGFLVFINPLSWLKKGYSLHKKRHSLHDKMLNKHIVWLKLWDDSQSKGMINADIPISLYVLQNTLNTQNKKTEIISEIKRKKLITTSTEYLDPSYSIPLAFHSIFNKLIQFIEKHNCSLEYKTTIITSSGDKIELKQRNNYTLEDKWAVDTYTIKDGIMVKKAIKQHEDANKHKLIIANKRGFKGAFIDEGKLGLTGNHKFYILGDNLEVLLKLLSFKISDIISNFTKYGQSFLDKESFTYLPDIRKLDISKLKNNDITDITDITEDKFYELIELTSDEINQIKNLSPKKDVDEEIARSSLPSSNNQTIKGGTIKRKTIKKNHKSRLLENYHVCKVVPKTSIHSNTKKRFNQLTKKYAKNTLSNRKKTQQTVKRKKSNNITRKNKANK